MMRMWVAGLIALSGAVHAGTDDLLAQNPALAALNAQNPDVMPEVWDEMSRIQALPLQRGILVPTEDNKAFIDLLQVNPALGEMYRRDPKATAKLLTIIRPQR